MAGDQKRHRILMRSADNKMHYSKTYAQLLLTLPPELQANAIEYRRLKRLINKVVVELSSLGLTPSVLQALLQSEDVTAFDLESGNVQGIGKQLTRSVACSVPTGDGQIEAKTNAGLPAKAVYEVVQDGMHFMPRLRLCFGKTVDEGENEVLRTSKGLGHRSRVSIFLDKSNSATWKFAETEDELTKKEEFLLISSPLGAKAKQSLVWSLQKRSETVPREKFSLEHSDSWGSIEGTSEEGDASSSQNMHPVELIREAQVSSNGTRELIIPLESDMAFFEHLFTALQSFAAHLLIIRSNFLSKLDALADNISHTARPQSSTSRSFRASSSLSNPQSISSPLLSPFSTSVIPGMKPKSDLYAWREIFGIYVETEVFESMGERDRGERSVSESERRLALFAERVTDRGLSDSRKLTLKESRQALETFLRLNVLILSLKKLQNANAEATRKILKKHAKRTALPFTINQLELPSVSQNSATNLAVSLPGSCSPSISHVDILALISTTATSLPHILVQAIGERLLPIIPHLDDYSCLICYNIAFKPIRLNCGHLFCVRCLVKMQKRSQDNCPCCRAPTVLRADRSNVDWALLNFMQDWFPEESAVKLKQNEEEVAKEEFEELGISDQGCIIS